jgi:hypothetical protein
MALLNIGKLTVICSRGCKIAYSAGKGVYFIVFASLQLHTHSSTSRVRNYVNTNPPGESTNMGDKPSNNHSDEESEIKD